MIYELWIGDRVVACTGNINWLLADGLSFHKPRAWGRPILITARCA